MNFNEHIQQGIKFFQEEKFDMAIEAFSMAIRLSPDAVVYDNREDAYKKIGRYDLAAKDAAEAVRLSMKPLSEDEIKTLLARANDGDMGFAKSADSIPGPLSQAEISALLGESTNTNDKQPGFQVLSKYEMELLSSGSNTGDKNNGERSPQILLPNQIEALSTLHAAFASTLAGRPRLPIQASVSSVAEITHEEFIRGIPESSILATASMKPLEGNAILGVDPYMAFSIADKLIGGIGERINSHQDFVNIAKAVMKKVFVHLLGNVKEAWKKIIDLQPELVRVDTDFQFVQIALPSDKVISVAFKAKLGDMEGSMDFCVPYTICVNLYGNM